MVRRPLFGVSVGALVAVAALAACSSDTAGEDSAPLPTPSESGGTTTVDAPGSVPATSVTEPEEAATSATVLGPAPESIDWSAPLIGGGSIDMTGYRDQAVMLWFWAPY
jgi:hypothetical protein